MWSRFTGSGKSDGAKDRDDERRKRSDASGTRRSKGAESVVSSSSTRRPSGRESVASSYATFATARDDRERGRDDMRSSADLYEDPRDDERRRRRRDDDERSTYSRRDRSRSRDRGDKDKDGKREREREKEKERSDRDGRDKKKKKSRSEAGGSRPQEIVESPRRQTRSVAGQMEGTGSSRYPPPDQSVVPMMSGGLPAGTFSSHVQNQFPGQDPAAQFAPPFTPQGLVQTNSFGEASEYYGDQGQSVQHQPGVRIERPSVIIPMDQPHLTAASAQPNPAADTGSGAAAEFYGTSNNNTASSKPPRPSSMPGAFTDDEPLPTKPQRPSSKPDRPGKFSSAATTAGAAGLEYVIDHTSSHTQHSSSHTNGVSGASTSFYHQGENPSTTATNGSYNGTSSYIPTYSEAMEGMAPPKPPRPGKPEKQPSGSSHIGLYTAGAAGLAAYGLAHHHSHQHSHSMPGSFPGENYGNYQPSPSPLMPGGMAHRHERKGPVSKFADWWKNYDDIRKMEEYTEYIGVCRDCFDPRSSPMDAPRKHHYNRRKRSGELRPSGIKEKHSRYGLNEKPSRLSLSGDEKRDKRKSSNTAGWIAAGLGGVGLAKAGQAFFDQQRNDFDDTYSIKSGRDPRSRTSRRSRSRSRSRDRRYGRSESRMSVGITGDRKDHKKVHHHRSRSWSRSHSRDRKPSLLSAAIGAGLGAGLAGTAVSASRKKHRSRSRSRSNSPQRGFVRRRNSSDRERRTSKNQRLKNRSSRSSVGSASVVDVSRPHQAQGGFLGGFFAAPPPKEKPKEKRRKTHTHSKKKKGFFNFGNASTSSSDSDIAFGQGFVRRKQRPSRRNSDEKLNATLVGLGATAAAIAAAQAGRNKGRHRPEVVAVRENRHQARIGYRPQSGAPRYGDVDADGWEDLPDDDTSDSGSVSSGLAFGDYDLKKTKSRESLNSNGSGTNKWGWRWGSKKQKKPSTESLYNAGTNTALVGPLAAGVVTGAAIGTGLRRQDSNASSSLQSLQNVHPVASGDPNSYDARRTHSLPTPQPLVTSQTGPMNIQQPQPIHQVPGSIYASQAPPQSGYMAPSGPPVFSQMPQPPYPDQYQSNFDPPKHPGPPRRANSSPVHSSSWKRDAAFAAVGAGLTGAAIAAAKKDRPSSSQSNVRFEFTEEQARKERERHKDQQRQEEEERRRRREEDDRKEQERRRLELQRQQDEARKYREAEQREAERRREQEEKDRREQEERIARRAREKAEEHERREREARMAEQRKRDQELEEQLQQRRIAEQRKRDLEFEEEQKRRERREADRRAAEQREAEKREAEIQQDLERRWREREAEEHSSRYENDRDRRKIEQQITGSSVASDVRRKERELEDRERDIVKPNIWKSPAAAATAAVAAAAITNAAISSSKRDERPSKSKKQSSVKTVEPAAVKTITPSMVAQDYADDDIFDPDLFKKKRAVSPIREPHSAQEVLREWEDRYTSKHEPVSQAEFFAPKELLEKTSAPVTKIDPNEGAPDLHIYQAHDDHDFGPPRRPPYPTSYSFTATKDGRGPTSEPYPIPELNLIQPTPPGSRANSVRAVSQPPSPAIEPVREPKKEENKQADANRRSSRVSWGTNQFHNYEVPTPDSYREQYISDRDLKDYNKQAHDEIIVGSDSPKSGKKSTSYRPEPEEKLPEPEVPSSTQYVANQEEDDWAGTMSKKASKKDKKKAKAAAAAFAATAAAATTAAVLAHDRDDTDNASILTDPFADKYAASVVSAAPSTGSTRSGPYYDSASDVTVVPARPKGSFGDAITSEPEQMHIPGSFDDDFAPATETPPEDEWAASDKKDKKGKKKKKSKSADDETIFVPESSKTKEPIREPEPVSTGKIVADPEVKPSKKDKKKKKSKSVDEDPYAQDISDTAKLPEQEPEPVAIEERKPEPEKLSEDEWALPTKLSKKDKKKKKSKGPDDDFFDQPSTSTYDTRNITEPEPTREPLTPEPDPEKPADDEWTTTTKLSKKDKKKKAKAAKRGSVDSPDDTESSRPSTPLFERDPRDIEPTVSGGVPLHSSQDSGSSSGATTATLAGGFAALVGAAMKQDNDRMSSDLDQARKNLESASNTTNGSRSLNESDRRSLPSTAFHDIDELGDVKTPKKKKRSSGKWSPSIGSPLRSEIQYDDYIGSKIEPSSIVGNEPSKLPALDLGSINAAPTASRDVTDSGYYAPDDPVKPTPASSAERDSDEFFSAGSEERKSEKGKSPSTDQYKERDRSPVVSPSSKYPTDLDREERRRRRHETHSRSQSRDRGYELDNGDSPSKRRHHRRRETDEPLDDWDSRSIISESRSEGGERRRKHRSHHESERRRSPEDYHRSSANSEPGDIDREHKSSKRRSKRDDDDNMSIVSSPARYDEERTSKKDKEKRSSGLFGLFSKSKESLVDTSSKPSRSKDDEDDEERRRRRKKHRERGSTYGSDDDDARSTISSSSRREKRRSRTDTWDEKEPSRSRYDDEDQAFLDDRAVAATPLPAGETPSRGEDLQDSGIPTDEPDRSLPSIDTSFTFPDDNQDAEHPTTPIKDPRAFLTKLTGLQPWQLEAFPDELPPLPASPMPQTPEPPARSPLSERASSSTSVPIRFRRPGSLSPTATRSELKLDLKNASSPASSPLRPRHAKSHSGQFVDSREYRPLYLVERNRKSAEIEEEMLPALPSSGSPSRASSANETEDEYQSAFESAIGSPSASTASVSDVFEDAFATPMNFVSPPYTGPEPQHSELADREAEELPESQQTTPKASSFPAGVLDVRRGSRGHAALPAEDLSARLEQVRSEEAKGLGVSMDSGPAPLAPSAPIDDFKLQDVPKSRSRDPSPSKSSSRLQDAALGVLVGGITAAALRHRSPSPSALSDDFMGGDLDQDTVDAAAASAPIPQPEESVRTTLARVPSSSSKTKKGKKGSKGKSIDLSTELPKELTAEDHQKIREADTADAVAGWFADPVEEPKPIEKKPEPIEVKQPEPSPELLRRDSKGKGKAKKKGKGKKTSISETAESPAPTPTEEYPQFPVPISSHDVDEAFSPSSSKDAPIPSSSKDTGYVPGSSTSFIPTFNDNENNWTKNRAETAVTDDATLVGGPSAGASPETTSKEFRRQKILDHTAPRGDPDMDVQRAMIGYDDNSPLAREMLASKLGQFDGDEREKKPEAQTKLEIAAPTAVAIEPVARQAELEVAPETVAEDATSTSKGKKAKKAKKGKRGSQVIESEVAVPAESTKEQIEQEILKPVFDAGEMSKYLVADDAEVTKPVVDVTSFEKPKSIDAGEMSKYLVTDDTKETRPVEPIEPIEPIEPTQPSKPLEEFKSIEQPVPIETTKPIYDAGDVSQYLVADTDSRPPETSSTPAVEIAKETVEEPVKENKANDKAKKPSTAEPASGSGWGKSLLGAFGWGKKKSVSDLKSPAQTPTEEEKSVASAAVEGESVEAAADIPPAVEGIADVKPEHGQDVSPPAVETAAEPTKDVAEGTVLPEPSTPAEEDDWALASSAKKKKDKKAKKEKRGSLAVSEPADIESPPARGDEITVKGPEEDVDGISLEEPTPIGTKAELPTSEAPEISRDLSLDDERTPVEPQMVREDVSLQETEEQDEWAASLSKKEKKKKGKKSKSVDVEPTSESTADVIDRFRKPNTPSEPVQTEPERPSEGKPIEELSAPVQTQVEDDWAAPLSKKEKKKKGKKSKSIDIEPSPTDSVDKQEPDLLAEATQAESALPEAVEEPKPELPSEPPVVGAWVSSQDKSTEDSTPADQASPGVEDDEWAIPSKKDKKKGKNGNVADVAPPTADVVEEEIEPVAQPTVETIVDEPSNVPAESVETLQLTETMQDDEWAAPLSRKEKKKKGKKARLSEPSTPVVDEPSDPIAEHVQPSASEEITDDAILGPVQDESIREIPASTEQSFIPAPSEQTVEESATPNSKKSKKKKAKKGSISQDVEPETPSIPILEELTNVENKIAEQDSQPSEPIAAIEKDDVKPSESITNDAAVDEPVSQPTEVVEDEWALPSKKDKKKKGKKGRASASEIETPVVTDVEPSIRELPVDENIATPAQSDDVQERTPPEVTAEPEAQPISQDLEIQPSVDLADEPSPEQEFTAPLSKKDRKKAAKKAKKGSMSGEMAPVETVEPSGVDAAPQEKTDVSSVQPEQTAASSTGADVAEKPGDSLPEKPAEIVEAQDDWAAPVFKKDKKKKKDKKGVSETDTPVVGTLSEEPLSREEQPVLDTPLVSEPQEISLPTEELPRLEDTMLDQSTPEPLAETPSVEPDQEQKDDDEWTAPPSKKDKKKKKKGKSVSIVESEPSTPVQEVQEPVLEEKSSEAQAEIPVVEPESEQPPETPSVEPESKQEDVDEWAVPLSKKDKKKKAKKGKQTAAWEESEPSTPVAESVEKTNDVSKGEEVPSLPVDEEAKAEQTTSMPAANEEAKDEQPIEESKTEALQEDEWAAPLSKKDKKKAKKAAKRASVAESEPSTTPATPLEETKETLLDDPHPPDPDPDPDLPANEEADFTAPLSKKDKKAKKAKRGSLAEEQSSQPAESQDLDAFLASETGERLVGDAAHQEAGAADTVFSEQAVEAAPLAEAEKSVEGEWVTEKVPPDLTSYDEPDDTATSKKNKKGKKGKRGSTIDESMPEVPATEPISEQVTGGDIVDEPSATVPEPDQDILLETEKSSEKSKPQQHLEVTESTEQVVDQTSRDAFPEAEEPVQSTEPAQPEEPVDDEWVSPVKPSKKDKKKAKKGKGKESNEPAPSETPVEDQIIEGSAEAEAEQHFAEPPIDDASKEITSAEPTSIEVPSTLPEHESPAEDKWAPISKKAKKKAKKGKDKQSGPATPIAEETPEVFAESSQDVVPTNAPPFIQETSELPIVPETLHDNTLEAISQPQSEKKEVEDDEWAALPAKKKKGKKGKKSDNATPTFETIMEPHFEEQSLSEQPQEDAVANVNEPEASTRLGIERSLGEDVSTAPVEQDEPKTIAASEAAVEPEDDWATLAPMKNGKKAKGKKSESQTPAAEITEPVVEPEPSVPETPAESQPTEADKIIEPMLAEETTEPATAERTGTDGIEKPALGRKLSKKENKAKKKAAASAWDEEPVIESQPETAVPEPLPTDDAVEQISTPVAKTPAIYPSDILFLDQTQPPAEAGTPADNLPASERQDQTTIEPGVLLSKDAEPEDEWANFGAKKGKKGKKNKKAKAVEASEELQTPVDSTPSTENNDVPAEPPTVTESLGANREGVEALITEPAQVEATPSLPAEHFQASTYNPIEEAEPMQEEPKEPEPVDKWTPISRKASKKEKKKGKKAKDATSEVFNDVAEPSVPTTSEPEQQPDQTISLETESQPERVAVPPLHVPVSDPVVDVPKDEVEDEWAVPSKKSKKDKKAKKAKSASEAATPTIEKEIETPTEPVLYDAPADTAKDVSREDQLPSTELESQSVPEDAAMRHIDKPSEETVAPTVDAEQAVEVNQDADKDEWSLSRTPSKKKGKKGKKGHKSVEEEAEDESSMSAQPAKDTSITSEQEQRHEPVEAAAEQPPSPPSAAHGDASAATHFQSGPALSSVEQDQYERDASTLQQESPPEIATDQTQAEPLSPSLKALQDEIADFKKRSEALDRGTAIDNVPEPPASEPTSIFDVVSKLSKKDKKKAKKGKLTAFDLSEPTTPAEPEPAVDTQDVHPEPVPEEKVPALSRKLSKKDKKKAKAAAFNWDESTEQDSSTPAFEPAVATTGETFQETASQEVPSENSEPASSAGKEIDLVEPAQPDATSTNAPEPIVEEAPVLSRKLSKKDKKKAKTTAFNWDEPTEQDSSTPASEFAVATTEETASQVPPGTNEPAPSADKAIDLVESTQPDTVSTNVPEPVVEEATVLSRKLSKKDKKAKKAALAWEEPSEDTLEPVTASQDKGAVMAGAALAATAGALTAKELLPTATPQEPDPVEEAPVLSRKLSKKDKKKKGKATAFDDFEPATPVEEPVVPPAPDEPLPGDLNEFSAPLSKKDKKKAKKKASAFDWTEPEKSEEIHIMEDDKPVETNTEASEAVEVAQDIPTAPLPTLEAVADRSLSMADESQAPESRSADIISSQTERQTSPTIDVYSEPSQPPVEDEWATPVKKSKKEKHKSKAASTTWDGPAEDSQISTPTAETPAFVAAPEPTTVDEPAEDEWALPFKKSKKEKRKSKKAEATLADEPPMEVVEPSSEVVVAPATIPTPIVDTPAVNVPELVKELKLSESAGTSSAVTEPQTVSPKVGKKKGKKHKLAAMFEPDTPEEFETPIAEPPPKVKKIADRSVSESAAETVQPSQPELAQALQEKPSAKSPEHDIDFAATIAAGLKESGFDTDLVLNDPAFQRSTSPPGAHDLASDEDVAAARHGASKSKFGTLGRSPSPTSPKGNVSTEQNVTQTVVTAATERPPTFDPMDILNDPTFTQRKSPPGVLEEADPDELWSSINKGKKAKGKKKRASLAKGNIEVVGSGPASGAITPFEEDLEQEAFTGKNIEESKAKDDEDWTVGKQKGKEGKTDKASGVMAAAAGAAALGAVALSKKKEKGDVHSADGFELPPNFDQERKFPGGAETKEYPFPAMSTSNGETGTGAFDEAVKEAEDDEWDLPSKKKGKKDKKGKGKRGVSMKQEKEQDLFSSPPVDVHAAKEPHGLDRHVTDTLGDRDIHVSRAGVSESVHPADRALKYEDEIGHMASHKFTFVHPDGEGVKRREHPVEPEAEPEEKRVHLSGPSQNDFSLPSSERSNLNVAAQPSLTQSHSPIIEPTWSFGDVRDSAVHVADSPVIPNAPQFSTQADIRDSGYHDAGLSSEDPSLIIDEVSNIHKRHSREPNTPRKSRALEDHDSVRARSPSLPEIPSLAGVTSPNAVDSATKERASYLFNSSPSTRQYGESPSSASRSHSDNMATIGAAGIGAADLTAAASSHSSRPHESPRHDKHTRSDSNKKHVSPTREVKHKEPYKSIFGDPTEKKAEKSPSMLSTPTQKHMRTPSSQLGTIKESSPDESPLQRKHARKVSEVGLPDRDGKSARRSHSPKPPSERMKSPLPVTPTPSSRKVAPPKIDTSPPTTRSPWQQVHESADRNMTLSSSRQLSHERSPPASDPVKQRLGEQRSPSAFSDRSNRLRSPDIERPLSAASNTSAHSLRRIDRSRSGDLRAAAKTGEARAHDAKSQPNLAGVALAAGATAAIVAGIASSSKYDPVKDKGKVRADMPDVYEAWGEAQGSPMSPTRPPSLRKRQSMQIVDLQSQLENLAAQNRSLEEARLKAEETLQQASYQREVDHQVVSEAVEARDRELQQKEVDIGQLRDTLQHLQREIVRLTELNNSLTEANQNLTNDANARYAQLQAEGQAVQDSWHESSRELEQLRAQHSQLTNGMQAAVAAEIGLAIDERNAEIKRLNTELDSAREQIKDLQKQILASKKPNESFLTVRDEDYFDSACQQLCQHVQQWVLRFSKFSDTRQCRLSSEVTADTRLDAATRQKIDTRLDNAILDGSDVDSLLADRVKRRDVFMSVVMTMIWEYVFTRYLFGMDREQRQKLKSLEKTLSEVGPTRAVAQWRAITLTLLSKREPFVQQRAQDTEAVVHEIYSTLATLLPPPSNLQRQIQESLRNVMRLAVSLSIEMRTQRAEYIMLPPLQPEYDTNGDLIAKVTFNASLMNERSGQETSNDELEARGAIVKIVLFPLVVKKGDDFGEGEDEIVVCPAQVLVARPNNKKVVRVMSGAMSVDSRKRSATSILPDSSIMDLDESNMI